MKLSCAPGSQRFLMQRSYRDWPFVAAPSPPSLNLASPAYAGLLCMDLALDSILMVFSLPFLGWDLINANILMTIDVL